MWLAYKSQMGYMLTTSFYIYYEKTFFPPHWNRALPGG